MFQYDLINIALVSASAGDGFDWVYVGKHAFNLILLIGVLIYFIKTPFLNFLKSRKEKLTSQINQAKETIEQAKLKHEEYSKKFENLSGEIDSLKDSIKKQGQIEKDELVKQAQNSSDLIKNELKETIQLETSKAKEGIQNEVVNSSIVMAENLIKDSIDDSYTTDSVDDFINMIEEGKWQQLQH